MTFTNTLGMQLASLITMLVLVAGSPAPAFVAFAQSEETPPPAETQTPSSEQEPAPAPAPEPPPAEKSTTAEGPQETPALTTETPAKETGTQKADETPSENDGAGTDGEPGEPQVENHEAVSETGDDGGPGENGEAAEGENGEAPAPAPDGEPSVIVTGDASAGTTGALEGNNTEIDTNTPPSGGSGGGNGGSGGGEVAGVGTEAATMTNGVPSDVDLTLDNALAATSTASSTAETGENEIVDPDGAIIETGRADAFAYLISLFNVAVLNSTGSILFLRNPRGDALDLTQRIIDAFASRGAAAAACSFLGCSLADAAFRMLGNNEVEITNVAIARSTTGDNHATSTAGFAGVHTGDASAFAGIVNFGNLQIIDSRYLILLMTNQGDLSGDILLPEGDFFKTLSAGAKVGKGTDLDITNDADIANTGSSSAETGGNISSGDILTGDASAAATELNFVNQIGAPICFIVSVGGTWHGDVQRLPEGFSREQAPFGDIICGAGGEAAEGVYVEDFHATTTNYAKILNHAIAEASTGGNTAEGLEAAIATGNADAFVQILNLVNQTIIGQDWIFALFTVTGDWNGDLLFGQNPAEPDIIDDLIEQYEVRSNMITGGLNGNAPEITLAKTASVQQVSAPGTVDYEIVVDNTGGPARSVIVSDTLKGPDGDIIGSQSWDLGSLAANEKVTITYTVEFTGKLAYGYYTNTASLVGRKDVSVDLTPIEAQTVVELVEGDVLGENTCEPLLTQYIRPGRANSSEQVQLLQNFLNDYEGEHLIVSGVYDSATQKALKTFQSKYAEDILAPWGISQPTGHVYYTTQKKVNGLYCNDEEKFQLTEAQTAEIENFRMKLPPAPHSIDELLQLQDIGTTGTPDTAKLLPPAPDIPVIHLGVPGSVKNPPVSILKTQPFQLLSSWLLSAVPFVEAMEL